MSEAAEKRNRVLPIRADYAAGADLLRVLSIFLIAWYHIWQQSWLSPNFTIFGHTVDLQPCVRAGYAAVDIMLMLSGFLLTLGHFSGRNTRPGDFYRARARRILPSYLACIFLLLFAYALPKYASFGELLGDLVPHLTFTHNLFARSYTYTNLNGALWTLAVEVQFYAIFPLIIRAFERRPAVTYAAMTLIAFGCHALTIYATSDCSLYVNRLPNMLGAYANGMLAARVYRRLAKDTSLRRRIVASAVCVVCAVGIVHILRAQSRCGGDYEALRHGQLLWRFPLTFVGAAFAVGASLSLAGIRAACSNPVVRFLSGISFNFYIWHQFIAVRLKAWHIPAYTGDSPNVEGQMPWQSTYTLLCFAAALLCAVCATYLIEKPCARLLRKKRLERGRDAC